MDTALLRTFIDVVHLGSFAEVARRHNVDPSQVSRAVATLEEQLGARLFQRSTRRLEPTEAALRFFEHVEPLVRELDAAMAEAGDSTSEVRGTLRVTASVAFGARALVPMLAALRNKHPQLLLDLVLTDAVLDVLAERIDIAFRLGPKLDTGLLGMRLMSTRYRVVASPAWIKRHGLPSSPEALSALPVATFPLAGFRDHWRFRDASGAETTVAVSPGLLISNGLGLLQAAADGLGPTLLADWLTADDRASGRLVDLFPQHEATATDFDTAVWLLYASRQYLPLKVRAFIDFSKAWFAAREA
jgi:DNA-binding transcriptional LysR family regulator